MADGDPLRSAKPGRSIAQLRACSQTNRHALRRRRTGRAIENVVGCRQCCTSNETRHLPHPLLMDYYTEIDGIFRLTTPLPFRPRSVNAYLVALDGGGWMLVDGGMDSDEAWLALSAGVDACASWRELKLHVVTHMHLDHIGLAERVRDASSVPLAMGELDADRAGHASREPEEEGEFRDAMLRSNGAPEEVVTALANQSISTRPSATNLLPPTFLFPSAAATVGAAPEWEAVWTPGHTAGHISLFRSRDRTLIAGDAVIPRVSPTIGVNRQRSDPVGDFLATLDRLEGLSPRVILGGHGETMFETGRIDELRREVRAEALRVRNLLSAEPATAWKLAVRRYDGRELPTMLRVLALRETRAHLDRLAETGAAIVVEDAGRTLFALPS